MNSRNKILSMLGLAQRAGRVESGEFCCERAVKSGRAKLVIVAEDASPGTKKSFRDMCDYYKVAIRTGPDRETMGRAIGRKMRVSLAVTDDNFANAILKMTEEEEIGGSANGR